MSLSEKQSAWGLMEDAVIRDRGDNEEVRLSRLIQSYLSRRGLADTLAAFNMDVEQACATSSSPVPQLAECCIAAPLVDEVKHRKRAQMLCLNGSLIEAAALLPSTSILRVKLLCISALQICAADEALNFLMQEVAPLIPVSTNTTRAHALYTNTIAAVLTERSHNAPGLSASQLKALALEVNETLISDRTPSSLNVLLSWLDFQHALSVSS